MLKHEFEHYLILREALKVRNGDERLGWTTSMPNLASLFSRAGLDGAGRAPKDALLLMRSQRKIRLQCIYTHGLRYEIWDYFEYTDEREFFSSSFSIVVTPEGVAYFNELEAKLQTLSTQAEVPDKAKEIGFHS